VPVEADPAEPASHAERTRLRLIEVAAQVFADQGFRAARIRDVVALAEANIAAVNYHFGGKLGLYVAVMRHYRALAGDAFPMTDDGGPPERRLGAFVRSLVDRVLSSGAASVHGRLMAREMVEPTPYLDEYVRTVIRPSVEQLDAILVDLAGRPLARDEATRLLGSVIGQVMFHKHGCGVIERLRPGYRRDDAELDALVRHITTFSIAGVRAVTQAAEPPAASGGAKPKPDRPPEH